MTATARQRARVRRCEWCGHQCTGQACFAHTDLAQLARDAERAECTCGGAGVCIACVLADLEGQGK